MAVKKREIAEGMELFCGKKATPLASKCFWTFNYFTQINVHAAQINTELLTQHKCIKWNKEFYFKTCLEKYHSKNCSLSLLLKGRSIRNL